MVVTRAAENTVFFVSANMCHRYNNSRSYIIAPDGRILAATELAKEQLVYADIRPEEATRAMYLFNKKGIAEVLFGTSVGEDEFSSVKEVDMTK